MPEPKIKEGVAPEKPSFTRMLFSESVVSPPPQPRPDSSPPKTGWRDDNHFRRLGGKLPLVSPDCVLDVSLVPETCPNRFVDSRELIKKFLERRNVSHHRTYLFQCMA
jgi:hypothetical protein